MMEAECERRGGGGKECGEWGRGSTEGSEKGGECGRGGTGISREDRSKAVEEGGLGEEETFNAMGEVEARLILNACGAKARGGR